MDKVYFVTNGSHIKIGYTAQSLTKRISQLNTGSVDPIYSLGWVYGDRDKEQQLHTQFLRYRIRENSEWFKPNEQLIDFINQNNEDKTSYVEVIDGQVSKLFRLLKI